MLDELVNEAKESTNHHGLTRQGEGNDFMPIRRDASLSVRQQVNLIQQGRQERGVRQRRDMNDFLDLLDKEIDDATPVGTKNKYKPIQDDFEVVSFNLIYKSGEPS